MERILGEGGMGVVVLAQHLELDQPVAIKFLLEGLADREEGAERFRREARAAAKIHSDHVVRVLDVGVMPDGVRYMVMEYLEGRDLAEELAEHGPFPIGVACGFIIEAIDAVGHAHGVGIIHRDLKPANLFLAKRADGTQRIKVLDFGISKTLGASTGGEQLSLTKTSAWIGSPLYMAPEQMQSARDVDARADVWSLGAILYELISGVPPYEAESLPQLCNLLITTDARPIQSRNPHVSGDLAQGIMNCLVRDKEKRTADVGELARVIARYATTITGSGMSRAFLDRASLYSAPGKSASSFSASVPARSAGNAFESGRTVSVGPENTGSFVSSGAQASKSGTRVTPKAGASFSPAVTTLSSEAPPPKIETESSSSGMHAAWGATDRGATVSSGRKRGSNPLVWVASGLAALLVLGLVVLNQRGSNVEGLQAADVPQSAAPLTAERVDTSLDTKALVPEPALRANDVAPVDKDQQAAAPTSAVDSSPPASAASATTETKPAAKPRTARSTARRPAPSTEPTASPEPTAAPKPKPTDAFSDFGGRR